MSAEFILSPGESFIQCPYNTAHQITNARMLTHLAKCRKAYMNSLTVDRQQKAMRICKYNATHHVPDAELAFHEERCPDATSVLKFMSHHNSKEGERFYEERRRETRGGKRSRMADDFDSSKMETGEAEGQDKSPGADGDEVDWEREAGAAGYAPGYDPKLKLKSQTILYHPAGLTKSERRTFRNEVFVRDMINTKTSTKVELPVVEAEDNFKLTMPKIEMPAGAYPKEELNPNVKVEVKEAAPTTGPSSTADDSVPDPEVEVMADDDPYSPSQSLGEPEPEEASNEKIDDNDVDVDVESDPNFWPWSDGDDDDIYPGDDDDFAGFDPYA